MNLHQSNFYVIRHKRILMLIGHHDIHNGDQIFEHLLIGNKIYAIHAFNSLHLPFPKGANIYPHLYVDSACKSFPRITEHNTRVVIKGVGSWVTVGHVVWSPSCEKTDGHFGRCSSLTLTSVFCTDLGQDELGDKSRGLTKKTVRKKRKLGAWTGLFSMTDIWYPNYFPNSRQDVAEYKKYDSFFGLQLSVHTLPHFLQAR